MSTKLLIVDDSEHDRLAYCRTLRALGHEIMIAETLNSGLALVHESQPDVILLDFNLPDGDGLEFIRRLGEPEGRVTAEVIMLTGTGDERIAVMAMKAGARDYLIKEVTGGHLKLLPSVVERALRERAERQARWEVKREADRQVQLAAKVYLNITDGILITEANGRIVSVNPAMCSVTGYSAEELVGENPSLLKSNRHDEDFYRALWQAIGEDGYWQGEMWNRRKNGNLILFRETISAIRDEQGRLQNYVAVLTDITEAKQSEELIRHQAHHDPLTLLPNRALFMDRLRHQIAYAKRNDSALAVLFVDLDGFKAINDELGHEAGDDLLKEAAVRFKNCMRASDTLARLGGDEFTAVIGDLDGVEGVSQVVRKMLFQIALPFRFGSNERHISASIGIALFPADGHDAIALVKTADKAMYQAKRNGKNRYVLAS